VRGDLKADALTVLFFGVIAGFYVLANFGERNGTARMATFVLGAALSGIALLVGLIAGLIHLSQYALGLESADKFGTAEMLAIPLTVVGALGLLYLWSPVQRALARVLPIRQGSPVIYLTVVLGLILVAFQIASQVQSGGQPLTIADLLAQDVPLFLLAFVGVGIFIRRSPRETVERLGLVPPRQRRWWLIAVLGVPVFLAIAYGIERLGDTLSPTSQQQVTNATNIIFSRFNNPIGVILLGLLPGVVEETLFRGALVPRLGVVFTAVLFAALHTQYAITFATLEVFVLGIGLGVLRVRSGSTLPCMVTHAGYNIAVGLIAYLAK
jgi:membrane protease YdiL (CAAX protease family)